MRLSPSRRLKQTMVGMSENIELNRLKAPSSGKAMDNFSSSAISDSARVSKGMADSNLEITE